MISLADSSPARMSRAISVALKEQISFSSGKKGLFGPGWAISCNLAVSRTERVATRSVALHIFRLIVPEDSASPIVGPDFHGIAAHPLYLLFREDSGLCDRDSGHFS